MDALWLRTVICFLLVVLFYPVVNPLKFSPSRMRYYRDKVKSMFYHAYDSYLRYAYPLDELKPISCQGMDTWGSFSLTLIDSLDTLLIMGNESEFIRAANVIIDTIKVDANVNVSVFETNIRVVGGLLAAHFLSGRVAGMKQEAGWPCSGPLLRLAERFAQKLLPAFNTDTGMPYGTVNLRYGVHRYETPITCTAGVGTMILEFGTLSRITGAWTATDAGIGAGVDSYFEYLAKGALLFHRPRLMHQFNKYVEAINAHVRKEDWFVWVSMTKGQISLPIFQSLEAFWPGLLALTGNIDDAQRIIFQYSQITRQYGFPPEFYNIPSQEAVSKRSGYPLRPEFVESLYYIYRATGDPIILHLAANIIEAIEHSCRTTCGYATIKNVNDHTIEDRMESFFLSETTKYLYLLFDPENFINNNGTSSRIVETPNGPCILDAGGYIFNTEAHPLDPAAIYCCSAKRNSDIEKVTKFEDSIELIDLIDITDPSLKTFQKSLLYESSVPLETLELEKNREEHSLHNMRSDIEEEVEETEEGHSSNDSHLLSDGEGNEQGSLWKSATSVDASFGQSDRNDPNEDEKTKKETASEKIKRILDKAREFDKQINEKKRRKSNFAAELAIALKTMQEKLAAVVNASNHLSNVNMATKSGHFEKQKQLDEISMPIAICKGCCRPLDARFDSLALKKMMGLIYGRYIYPRRGIQSTNGPICAHNELPSLEDEYINQWPDVSGVDTRQILDAVDDIRLSSFRYHSLVEEHYELLSGPPLSYLSHFTGLGQVVPRVFNESQLHV